MTAFVGWCLAWLRAQTLGLRSLRASVRAWGRRHPRWRLAVRVTGLAAVLQLAVATAAYAAGDGTAGNPFLGAFGVKDTDGNSVAAYDLSLGGGDNGLMPSASDAVDSMLLACVTFGWELYRVMVTIALWFLDIALQYRVLDTLRPAAEMVATGLQTSIGTLGVAPIFLVISFIAMVYWIGQRRTGAGVLDFFLSLLASALLSSALANPVGWISGDDGLMSTSRDIGMSMAVQITSGGTETSDDSETLRRQTTGMLADKFIRLPHQLINYGAIVDEDAECKKVYDTILQEAPPEDAADPREAMGDCNEDYEAAANDPAQAFIGMLTLAPAGAILAILAGLLGLILLTFCLYGLYIGAKMVLDLLRACLPGSEKAGALRSAATLAVLAIATILLMVIVGGFLVFVEALFSGYDTVGLDLIEAFVLLDILMLAAIIALIVFWWKSHKAGSKLGDKLHQAMAPKPVSPPANDGLRAASQITARGAHLASAAAHRASASKTGDAVGQAHSGGVPGTVNAPGSGGGAAPRQRKEALLARVGKGVGTGSVKAVKYGAMSTVGAPVYAPRAAVASKRALVAKRAAVHSALGQAKSRARTRVQTATQDAGAFGREYVHNLGVAGRFVGRATGAAHLATWGVAAGVNPLAAGAMAAGTMFPGGRRHKQANDAPPSKPRPASMPASDVDDTSRAPGTALRAPQRGGTPPMPMTSATDVVLSKGDAGTNPTAERPSTSPAVSPHPAAQSGRPASTGATPGGSAPVDPAPRPAPSRPGRATSPTNLPQVPMSQTRSAIDHEEVRAGRERLMEKMRERARRSGSLPMAVGDER